NRIVGYNLTPVSRNWTDTNGNYIVDCDILNFAAQTVVGGDVCGSVTGNSLNYGKPGTSTRVNPALLNGWNVRPSDSQFGINLQQELAPRVSLEVGYNRRWWNNFTVTDNTLVGPSDYEPARTNFWQGVDVTVNARLRGQLTLQAGTTTGRATNDNCSSILNVDSPDSRYCRQVDPVETTIRGSASYMVPKVGVQVSAT